MEMQTSPHINANRSTIEFSLHNLPAFMSIEGALQVSLSGSFNNWAQDVLFLKPDEEGVWKIEIPMLPQGKYRYKFFVDDKMWMEDIDNPYREPDGLTGFNSILMV